MVPMLQPDPMLWTAIENTRMIQFTYHGKHRLAEPHDHGILNSSTQLLSYQVAGSSSRPLPNWLLTKVDEMTDLILLDQIFPGGRPTASGKHIGWDVLFIRVKPASDYQHAGQLLILQQDIQLDGRMERFGHIVFKDLFKKP